MKYLLPAAASLMLAACSSAPFSYAEDRCLGEHNQCQNTCTGIENGSARAACIDRCYDNESRCYSSGASGDGSSVAIDRAISDARTRTEKEAAYERWRAARQREQSKTGESDVEIIVLEQKDKDD
ncbi:hypothetical protein PUV54_12080 [Hyphococcus flavus]|uniref:Lipoprotein n=1 Tax=Hyphococcus flavus TaxID=1866326 RepID=A0AAE9ZDK9_9PROT|nr:hypothetical protein [Hyphococcus flavus]WDI30693.1 hypothetical protein PUV54_12080 [Hyphococcus flavus]